MDDGSCNDRDSHNQSLRSSLPPSPFVNLAGFSCMVEEDDICNTPPSDTSPADVCTCQTTKKLQYFDAPGV